jgi:hypothetical protein
VGGDALGRAGDDGCGVPEDSDQTTSDRISASLPTESAESSTDSGFESSRLQLHSLEWRKLDCALFC